MSINIRNLGIEDFESVWDNMLQFTVTRNEKTKDELWIVEHHPVYTLGLNARKEHLLNTGSIPVIQTDRGGQVTYHGPGQLVIYTLLDMNRNNMNIRDLVSLLEMSMITALKCYDIYAEAKKEAPGVYIQGKKIGSIGLRIKKNCCYHGLSLNNSMDLRPFNKINPCGFPGLEVTQVSDFNINISNAELAKAVIKSINLSIS
jgi:lipoyl(octanoyl) transferase